MAEPRSAMIWPMRVVFLVLAGTILFANLLPLEAHSRSWVGPDILLALTFAWILRRSELVTPVMVAIVFLLADLLLQRPPGLWAAIVLLGAEALRSRAPLLRDLTFGMEMVSVAMTMFLMHLGYRLVLAIMVVDRPPLGLTLLQFAVTLAAYPVVTWLSHYLFGVRKPAPGEMDLSGARL